MSNMDSRSYPEIVERCIRELETTYPGHAWLNAACACLRSMPGHVDGAGSTPASAPKDQGLAECGSSTLPPAPSEQPVAWQARDKKHGGGWVHVPYPRRNPDFEYRPLYTAPQPASVAQTAPVQASQFWEALKRQCAASPDKPKVKALVQVRCEDVVATWNALALPSSTMLSPAVPINPVCDFQVLLEIRDFLQDIVGGAEVSDRSRDAATGFVSIMDSQFGSAWASELPSTDYKAAT